MILYKEDGDWGSMISTQNTLLKAAAALPHILNCGSLSKARISRKDHIYRDKLSKMSFSEVFDLMKVVIVVYISCKI